MDKGDERPQEKIRKDISYFTCQTVKVVEKDGKEGRRMRERAVYK